MTAQRRKNRDVSSPAARAAESHSARSESVSRTVSRLSRDSIGASGFRASVIAIDGLPAVTVYTDDPGLVAEVRAAIEEWLRWHG